MSLRAVTVLRENVPADRNTPRRSVDASRATISLTEITTAPRIAEAPFGAVTVSPDPLGSIASLKPTRTSVGRAATLPPTRGAASLNIACASAADPDRIRLAAALAMRRCQHVVLKDRTAERMRKYVVEIEVDLAKNTDMAPAFPVEWDQCLDAELHGSAHPDYAGIDRARGPPRARGGTDRRCAGKFNQRDEAIDKIGQTEIDDVGLEVGQAVLHRSTQTKARSCRSNSGPNASVSSMRDGASVFARVGTA